MINKKISDKSSEQPDSVVVSDDPISCIRDHSDLVVDVSSKEDVDEQLNVKSEEEINESNLNSIHDEILIQSPESAKNLTTDNDQVNESLIQSDSLPISSPICITNDIDNSETSTNSCEANELSRIKARSARIELLLQQLSEEVKEMDNELFLLAQDKEKQKKSNCSRE